MSLLLVALFVQIFVIRIYALYVNQDINCTNNTVCIIECSEYRGCALSFIHCNNARKCNIFCNAQESCKSATIHHTSFNKEIEINCINVQSCGSLQIKHDPDSDVIITTNRSLTLNALSESASPSISISDITTFSDINIHCAAKSSCTSMMIDINTNINNTLHINNMSEKLHFEMNIYCSGIESCTNMEMSVSDVSEDNIDNYNYIEWEDFNISLHCNNSQSCQYAAINTEKLKINSLNSSDSFGDLYLFCNDVDEACLFMHIRCPDLVQFHAIYDYLYQTPKCHLSLCNSYENHVSIISKHGVQMIDIICDNNDDLICDGITLYCSEDPNTYYCSMQYNISNNDWYCDNHDIYYTFMPNHSYGCDEFIWLDDIAIIETSKIPNYNNETVLSCSMYNPSIALIECFMYCDSDYSCANDIRCDNSTKCHIECSGLQSCKDPSFHNYIWCPNTTYSIYPSGSSCTLIIDPLMLTSEYGGWYSIYMIYVDNATAFDLTISHNIGSYVHDYGMSAANITILNSDHLSEWNVEHDVESWYRVLNYADASITQALTVNILCQRCYTDWVELTQYTFNRNVSVYLSCIQCSGTSFDGYGITSFQFDCLGICNYSSIGFTDSNANINCYDTNSCNGMSIYLIPSTYASYIDDKYEYYLNLLDTSSYINIYSLYGFNQLYINHVHNDTDVASDEMDFYCGYPDYYIMYNMYDDVNETQCLQSNPLYSSSVVGLFEWQYAKHNITAETIYCTVYKSCQNSALYCSGTDCIIHCDGVFSCQYADIYSNYYIGNDKQTQNSVHIWCMGYNACNYVNIYGNDVDDLEIHCTAGDGCNEVYIYHQNASNPRKGLNVICYDKYKFANVLPADFVFHWPSCRSMYIYCPLIGCNINLEASTYVDQYDINIYYAQGFHELNISCELNEFTNRSTCYDVDYHCNSADDGNYRYYSTFDDYTGECVGECCEYIFSYAPTSSPSIAPTTAPTSAPTFSPTYSPTASPTRYPTIFEFDAYFISQLYIIVYDEWSNWSTFNISNIKSDVITSMEYGYLSASTRWSYSEYMVTITNFTSDLWNGLSKCNFTAKIFAESDVISHYATYTEVNDAFYAKVSEQLEIKWNVSNISFGVYEDSTFTFKPNDNVETPTDAGYNSTLIVFISFTVCIWIIAFLSFLHSKNKLKCMDKIPNVKPCDDAQYLNVIKYGMQSLDLYSDVIFCWELYVFSETLEKQSDITVITVLYSLSFIFFILPYLINLIFAVIFEKVVGDLNQSIFTRNWFHKYSTLFAVLVIISGSVSASLQLINSSIFGVAWFHSGFSKYNLLKMHKFRIIFTVLIENIPQFIIQFIYVSYFSDKRQDVVTFAFVVSTSMSILSILSSIMSYFLQQKHVAQYQTKFNIEIILIDNAASAVQFDRIEANLQMHDTSAFKIDVSDKNVKKLHKRGNLRKIMRENIAKCIGKLADNFELLYCVEQIDGLTFNGVCSSDSYHVLDKLFNKNHNGLSKVIKQIYELNVDRELMEKTKQWKIEFVVFDENGQPVGNDAHPDYLNSNHADNKSIQLTDVKKPQQKEQTADEYCD